MLHTTMLLKDQLNRDQAPWRETRAAVELITLHGGPDDALALLPLLLQCHQHADLLLPLFLGWGTHSLVEQCVQRFFNNVAFDPQTPSSVLHLLGYFGYEPATRALWTHARMQAAFGDYDHHTAACLGLLSLPCSAIQQAIATEIRSYRGKNLFPELVPVLAHKTQDPELWSFLYELGSTTASTDCNGGLISGIAFYGRLGAPLFERLLWDPYWEAYGGGTGSDRWAYAGLHVLQWPLAEVLHAGYEQVLTTTEPRQQEHSWQVLLALLNLAIDHPRLWVRGIAYQPLDYAALYRHFFAWRGNQEGRLIECAKLLPDQQALEDVYKLEVRFEARLARSLVDQELLWQRQHRL